MKTFNNKTVEELLELGLCEAEKCDGNNWIDLTRFDKSGLRSFAEAVAEACSPQWIPVEERLPECGNEVLLTTVAAPENKTFQDPKYRGVFQGWIDEAGLWCDSTMDYKYVDAQSWIVTHWMPLPNPPQPPQQGDV